jgi:hypothetical protein
MLQSLKASSKTRKEYLTKVYETINSAVYGYGGAVLTSVP